MRYVDYEKKRFYCKNVIKYILQEIIFIYYLQTLIKKSTNRKATKNCDFFLPHLIIPRDNS